MKKVLYFLLILCSSTTLHGQNITLSGHISDLKTGAPLPYANIQLENGSLRAISDELGNFSLTLSQQEPVLIFTYLGYLRQEIKVPETDCHGLEVRMHPTDVSLPGVTITDHRLELTFPDQRIHIHDYEFFGEQLVLILHDYTLNRPKLVLFNQQDSILAENLCPEPPGSLIVDCFGRVQAFSRNHVYQVFYRDGELLVSEDDRQRYQEKLSHCVGYYDHTCYFEFWQNNQIKHFYYQQQDSADPQVLRIIRDEVRLRQRQDLGLITHRPTKMGDLVATVATPACYDEFDIMLLEHAFFDPVYSPFFISGDEILLFNHVDGLIEKYRVPDQLLSETPVRYHKNRKWRERIIRDKISGDFYTLFGKHGWERLVQLNPETGELGQEWELEKPFPEKIQVRDGILYFMYRDHIYDDTKRLYQKVLGV